MSNMKRYMEEVEAIVDAIPGIMDKTEEAECLQEVIDFALDYLHVNGALCKGTSSGRLIMDRFDTEIVDYYIAQNFNEYWSLV